MDRIGEEDGKEGKKRVFENMGSQGLNIEWGDKKAPSKRKNA